MTDTFARTRSAITERLPGAVTSRTSSISRGTAAGIGLAALFAWVAAEHVTRRAGFARRLVGVRRKSTTVDAQPDAGEPEGRQ
jgi:hypothetical protein